MKWLFNLYLIVYFTPFLSALSSVGAADTMVAFRFLFIEIKTDTSYNKD
jgi:hypothetical protein